jgi:hypothetical protein
MALIVTTSAISSITTATATGGGTVTSTVTGVTLTAKGVVWNTSPNPTIANSKTTNGTSLAPFVSSLTGLLANNTYYVRAYATTGGVTTYGNQVSFTAGLAVDLSTEDYDLWAKIGYIPGVTPTDESIARQLAYLAAEAVIHEQP